MNAFTFTPIAERYTEGLAPSTTPIGLLERVALSLCFAEDDVALENIVDLYHMLPDLPQSAFMQEINMALSVPAPVNLQQQILNRADSAYQAQFFGQVLTDDDFED